MSISKGDKSFRKCSKEDDGFGAVFGRMFEHGTVACWVSAEDGGRTWVRIDPQALRAEGNPAIRADFDRRAKTPDIGPPWTARRWP